MSGTRGKCPISVMTQVLLLHESCIGKSVCVISGANSNRYIEQTVVMRAAAIQGAKTMLIIQAAVSLQELFSHEAMLPVTGGAFAGLALALFRSPVRPFGIRESESLMNFSSLGTLRCICGASHPESVGSDRREFCRSCGCEVAVVDETLLDRQISKGDAQKLTRELRDAGIRASRLGLPPSITSLAELKLYLASDPKRNARAVPMSQSAVAVEQPQAR